MAATLGAVLSALFLFTSLQQCICQTRPYVVVSPPSLRSNKSDSVEINCKISHAFDYPHYWGRINPNTGVRQGIANSTNITVNESRYSVRYVPNYPNATYILRIDNVHVSDAGLYECTIAPSLSKNFSGKCELKVLFPPAISENFAKILTVNEGEPARLECNATGYPPPTVFWRRQHNVVLANGRTIHRKGILEIPSAKKEDRGVYLCTAENGIGKDRSSRRSMLLQVHYTPVISVAKARVGQALKHDADLTCRIEGHPYPMISWYRDGQLIDSNDTYSVSTRTFLSTRHDYTSTTLRVKSIKPWHYGIYLCSAENRMGIAKQRVELVEPSA